MRDLVDRLEAWQAVGLVSPEQADAIAAFERTHAGARGGHATGAPLGSSAPPSQTGSRRTVFAEAVGYVGAALAVGAVGMIVGQLWGELGTAPRLTLVLLLTTLLAGSGAALTRVDRPPLQRLASVLLTGAVGGVAWGTTIVAVDLTALEEAQVALVGGLVPLSVALPLYLLRRRALHQLTVLVTVLVSAVAAMSLPAMTPEPMWYALLVIAIGGAWFALSAGGWLHPRTLGEVTGSVLVLLACQVPAIERFPWLLVALGVAVAGGLVALAIVSDRTHHLAVGAIGLFVLVPRLVVELFGDAIGGPAAMLVVGLLLVLLAVGVGRARREVGGVRAELPPPSSPPATPGTPDGPAPRPPRRRSGGGPTMTGTLTGPDRIPSERDGDVRSLPLLLAAAVLVVAVVGAVLLFGVERPPTLTSLADQRVPEPPAAVAWMGSGGMETCVRVAWPDATVTEPWCDRAGGNLVGWTDEGILLHRWEGSESLRVLDPVRGEFVGRSREARWEPPYEQPAAWTEHRGGELIVRLDDGTVVWRVETTDRYEIRTSAISADGAWVAMVDSADRLLLVPADGSSPPRVWAEGVTAWQTPVWEGTTWLR